MRGHAMQLRPTIVLLAACAAGWPGTAPAQEAARVDKEYPAPPPPPYVTPDTPQGSGPFKAVMEADPGLPTHTVYRPADLARLGGARLPIVAWGNGACLNVGNRFRYFLSEIASHGFLAIATGPIGPKEAEGRASSASLRGNPAPGSPGALKQLPPDAKPRPADTTAAQLLDAVSWAIAENARPGSKYYGRLDTGKVAVMGQSCGGVQAIDAAHDPRVTTLGVWNSGTWPSAGRGWELAAANADKDRVKTIRASAIYITGEPAEVAFKNADDDFALLDGVPAFRGWREDTGHGGTYREPDGGEFAVVATAWLQWQLKGDRAAARMFAGVDCGLCRRPHWHVKAKNLGAVPATAGQPNKETP